VQGNIRVPEILDITPIAMKIPFMIAIHKSFINQVINVISMIFD